MLQKRLKSIHPGFVLRDMYLKPLAVTQAEAAGNLGVTRKTLSMLINGHQGVSAEMALRLAKAFTTTPEYWLNMQLNYDLNNAKGKVRLSRIKAFAAM